MPSRLNNGNGGFGGGFNRGFHPVGGPHTDWGVMLVNMAFWLIIVAAVAITVFLVARRLSKSSLHAGNTKARSILEERLARGEIKPDEFESRIELLHKHKLT